MPDTNSTFSSIDTNLLADVSGGCGGGRCRHRSKVVNIVNNYNSAPAQAAPAAAPTGGLAVNVSAGYAQV